jgi:serine/threonine protein kinase
LTISRDELVALSRLLDLALELAPEERATWLNNLPEADSVLRPKLRTMLFKDDGAETFDFLHTLPKFVDAGTPDDATQAGDMVGSYRLIREIGRGGMSTVWLAERVDGVKRTVALKLPHQHLHRPLLAGRFVRECEILAGLTHGNIARLYDAGTAADGQPFLAMEYVAGVPLVQHCDQHHLGVRERLQLFIDVLAAVRYAHSRLVIHRDLKPSNILVTSNHQIVLLDFGVAKLIVEGDPGESELTQLGSAGMTLTYASPEQIAGESLTTASDIYSLGVISYKLLSGKRPYESQGNSFGALRTAILETPAPRLSSAISAQQAEHCGTTDVRLLKELRGDLDAIVAKALRKEPGARYETADAMREDLLRSLRGEPIAARQGARGYVLGRFVRRNRWLVASAALILLSILTGLVGVSWQARVAQRAVVRADAASRRANAVKDFLLDIFKQNSVQNPDGALARQVTAEQLLGLGADRIKNKLRDDPEVRDELLDTLGLLYSDLGFPDREVELQKEHIAALHQSRTPADGAEAVHAHMRLGKALAAGGKFDEAMIELNQALHMLDAQGDTVSLNRAEVLFNLAHTAYHSRSVQDPKAKANLLTALDIVERHHPRDPLKADITLELGAYAKLSDDFSTAEFWHRQALAVRQSLDAGQDKYLIGDAYLKLGDTLALEYRYAEAEIDLRKAIELLREFAGPDHPGTADAEARLGEMFANMGRPAEAAVLLRRALEAQRRTPSGLSDQSETIKTLARLEFARGRLSEAEALIRQNLLALQAHPSDGLRYGVSASNAVPILAAEGKFAEAEAEYAIAEPLLHEYIGETASGYTRNLARAGDLAFTRGRYDDAAEFYRRVLRNQPLRDGEYSEESIWATLGVAQIEGARNRFTESIPMTQALLERVLASPDRIYLAESEARSRYVLGELLRRSGQAAKAEEHLRRAVALRETLDDKDSIWLAQARLALADCLISQRQWPEAEGLVEAANLAHKNQPALAPIYQAALRSTRANLTSHRHDSGRDHRAFQASDLSPAAKRIAR